MFQPEIRIAFFAIFFSCFFFLDFFLNYKHMWRLLLATKEKRKYFRLTYVSWSFQLNAGGHIVTSFYSLFAYTIFSCSSSPAQNGMRKLEILSHSHTQIRLSAAYAMNWLGERIRMYSELLMEQKIFQVWSKQSSASAWLKHASSRCNCWSKTFFERIPQKWCSWRRFGAYTHQNQATTNMYRLIH